LDYTSNNLDASKKIDVLNTSYDKLCQSLLS
jgi:hypothetical protein